MFLQLAPHEQVELLISTAKFDVGFQFDRIPSLYKWVEKLVDGDGLAATVTLAEIIPLQHASHRVPGRQLDHAGSTELLHPGGVEDHFGFRRVQDLENLVLIRLCIFQHLLTGKWLACLVFSGWITDHAGEVTNQKEDVVAQVLELAQFVDQYCVAQMQIRCRGVEAGLDAQRTPFLELGDQLGFQQDFLGAPLDEGQRIVDRLGHDSTLIQLACSQKRGDIVTQRVLG